MKTKQCRSLDQQSIGVLKWNVQILVTNIDLISYVVFCCLEGIAFTGRFSNPTMLMSSE